MGRLQYLLSIAMTTALVIRLIHQTDAEEVPTTYVKPSQAQIATAGSTPTNKLGDTKKPVDPVRRRGRRRRVRTSKVKFGGAKLIPPTSDVEKNSLNLNVADKRNFDTGMVIINKQIQHVVKYNQLGRNWQAKFLDSG